MNKVILIGRLTRDPDIRYTQGAEPMAVARYTLAVNRGLAAGWHTESRFFIMPGIWIKSGVCRKISAERNEDSSCRQNPDWELHEQRWTEGIYHGSPGKRT